MAKRGPLSAAHKAAISAGMKRYWATKSAGGSSSSSRPIQNIDTGGTISREAAALVMFGSAGARKKAVGGKKSRNSVKSRRRK